MLLQINLYQKTIPTLLCFTGWSQGLQENIKTIFPWMDCEQFRLWCEVGTVVRERRFKEAWLEGWRAKWTCLQEIWGNLVKLLPQASISSSLIWWYEKGAVPAIEYVLILFTFYYQSTWKVERSHISHNKQNKRGKMKHSIHTARAHSEIKPG